MSTTAAWLRGSWFAGACALALTLSPTPVAAQAPPPGLKISCALSTRQCKIGDEIVATLTLENPSDGEPLEVLPLALDVWSISLRVEWTEQKVGKQGEKQPEAVAKSYGLIRYVPKPDRRSPMKRVPLGPGESISGKIKFPCLRAGEQVVRAHYWGYHLTPTSPLISGGAKLHGSTPGEGKVGATIETSHGSMELQLVYDKSPASVSNFIQLARAGTYNGTKFFRLVPGAWLQGGDPKNDGSGGPGYTIPMELNDTKHEFGTLSMCRGPHVNSGGSQFFFSLTKLPQYDYGHGYPHAAIGRLIDGQDVLRQVVGKGVEEQPAASPFAGQQNKPIETLEIKTVTIWVR